MWNWVRTRVGLLSATLLSLFWRHPVSDIDQRITRETESAQPRGSIDVPNIPDAIVSVPHQNNPANKRIRKPRPRIAAQEIDRDSLDIKWHFRRDILDRLDSHFDCLRRLRRYDPDSYSLLGKVGLAIPNSAYANPSSSFQLEQLSSHERPAFGGIYFHVTQKEADEWSERKADDRIYPSFIYFQKLRSPSGIQHQSGDIYSLTCLYDNRCWSRHRRLAYPVRCHIAIGKEGACTLLKEALLVSNKITRRTGARKEVIKLTGMQWKYPDWIADIKVDTDEDPNIWTSNLLILAIRTYEESQQRTIIRAKRGGMVASFGIDLKSCPRFFKDRDATVLARDGKRKRIFHSVIRHERTIDRNGIKQVTVKAHYRGMRHFDWNNYWVGIVFPTINPATFTAPASLFDDVPKEEATQMVPIAELGKQFQELLDS